MCRITAHIQTENELSSRALLVFEAPFDETDDSFNLWFQGDSSVDLKIIASIDWHLGYEFSGFLKKS